MSIKFIKELKKYVEKLDLTSSDLKNKNIVNFIFENTEGDECVLSARLAKFILCLINNNDSLAYELDKEQDYNRLLRLENTDLRTDLQNLEEEFENFKETGGNLIIDTTGTGFLN
jgi:hypothetical protein